MQCFPSAKPYKKTGKQVDQKEDRVRRFPVKKEQRKREHKKGYGIGCQMFEVGMDERGKDDPT